MRIFIIIYRISGKRRDLLWQQVRIIRNFDPFLFDLAAPAGFFIFIGQDIHLLQGARPGIENRLFLLKHSKLLFSPYMRKHSE